MKKLHVLLWMARYLERRRYITYEIFQSHWPGLSLRTYRRYVGILKGAGAVLVPRRSSMPLFHLGFSLPGLQLFRWDLERREDVA